MVIVIRGMPETTCTGCGETVAGEVVVEGHDVYHKTCFFDDDVDVDVDVVNFGQDTCPHPSDAIRVYGSATVLGALGYVGVEFVDYIDDVRSSSVTLHCEVCGKEVVTTTQWRHMNLPLAWEMLDSDK